MLGYSPAKETPHQGDPPCQGDPPAKETPWQVDPPAKETPPRNRLRHITGQIQIRVLTNWQAISAEIGTDSLKI